MSAYEVVTQNITFTGDGTYDTYTLSAPTGKKPMAGGFQVTNGLLAPGPNYGGIELKESYPSGSNWHFTVMGTNAAITATLYLVCIPTYAITADA